MKTKQVIVTYEVVGEENYEVEREELPPGSVVLTRERAIKKLKTIGISTDTHYVAEILDVLLGESEASE